MKKAKRKKILLYFLSFAVLTLMMYPPASLFRPDKPAAWILAVLGGMVLAPYPDKIYHLTAEKKAEQELLRFVQLTLNRLNAGSTLLNSMMEAARQRGNRASFRRRRKAYRSFLLACENNSSWDILVPLLKQIFPCPAAPPFFSLLVKPENLGDNIVPLFRRFELSLREQKETAETLAADRAKSVSECLSLAFMPVLLLLFLRISAPAFLDAAYGHPRGRALLTGAYLLFLLSLWLLRLIFMNSSPRSRGIKISRTAPGKVRELPAFMMKFLRPERLDADLNLLCSKPSAEEKNSILGRLARKRLFLISGGISLNLLAAAAGNYHPLLLLLPVLLGLYPARAIRRDAAAVREELQDALPLLFTFLSLCLSSFFSIESAFLMAESAFEENALLAAELKQINRRFLNREKTSVILEDWGRKLDFPEASMYLNLLAGAGEVGSSEDLQMLELQNIHFHHVAKEKQRKRLAARSNHYLLPMFFDLLAIMMISFAPLLPTLQI